MNPQIISLTANQIASINAALTILQWRYQKYTEMNHFGFKVEVYDGVFHAFASAGIEGTCAGYSYVGTGKDVDSAIEEMIMRVVTDKFAAQEN